MTPSGPAAPLKANDGGGVDHRNSHLQRRAAYGTDNHIVGNPQAATAAQVDRVLKASAERTTNTTELATAVGLPNKAKYAI